MFSDWNGVRDSSGISVTVEGNSASSCCMGGEMDCEVFNRVGGKAQAASSVVEVVGEL